MKNTLRLNHDERTIVMDRTFAKFAANTMSQEYAHLQRVRLDYPTYTVEQRHIKKAPAKECYKGLTIIHFLLFYFKETWLPPQMKPNTEAYAKQAVPSFATYILTQNSK